MHENKQPLLESKAKKAGDLTAGTSFEKSCTPRTEYSTNRDKIAGEMVPDIAAIIMMVMQF